MSEPEVAVVVATRDRAARLERLLDSLRRQTIGRSAFELIVVDDGSSDRTADVLAGADDVAERMLTMRGEGRGPAAARNLGWRAARAELVAFTDDDCEPEPGWLEQLLAVARSHPGSVVQGPTMPIERELPLEGPFTRTKRIGAPSPWYQTCNIAYPRMLLERLDGFDERFPEPLGEDTDLGWRARAAGARLVAAGEAGVQHAVDYVGPAGVLREARRGSDSVLVFKLHPELRRATTTLRVFRNPSLARAALAVAGLALARRQALGAVLVFPYALDLAHRVRAAHGGPVHAPFLIACDAVRAWASLRGSARHRVLII